MRSVKPRTHLDRWWEAVALTQSALTFRMGGDVQVAVRALLEHFDERGDCSAELGDPERCASLRTIWELASHGHWAEADAFFAEVSQDVLLS